MGVRRAYYEFWLQGEKLAEEDSFEELSKTVKDNVQSGSWDTSDIHDYIVIRCEELDTEIDIAVTIKLK